MNSRIPSGLFLGLIASLTTLARAQHTRVICEASGDYGVTWHDTLTVWPGQRVDVRVRLPIIDIPVGQPVSLLSGATYQPCLFGWLDDLGDVRLPFPFPGVGGTGTPTDETEYVGRQVIDRIGATGRINPFGAGLQSSTSTSGVLTSMVDADGVLRFAGSRNTTPTTNLAWGVATGQPPAQLTHTNYNFSHDPVVFRYAVVFSRRSTSIRTLTAVVPIDYLFRGYVRWYPMSAGVNTLAVVVRPEDIVSATILIRSRCPADLAGTSIPDPTNAGAAPTLVADGAVTPEDLLYFLDQFEQGVAAADLDDGSGTGAPDSSVTIDDLLFFLAHFELGC